MTSNPLVSCPCLPSVSITDLYNKIWLGSNFPREKNWTINQFSEMSCLEYIILIHNDNVTLEWRDRISFSCHVFLAVWPHWFEKCVTSQGDLFSFQKIVSNMIKSFKAFKCYIELSLYLQYKDSYWILFTLSFFSMKGKCEMVTRIMSLCFKISGYHKV